MKKRKVKSKKHRAGLKLGKPPGTLVYTGEIFSEDEIRVIDYDSDNVQEFTPQKIEDCFPFKESQTNTWIDIIGLHNVKNIEII
ncbi:MAG: magnesium and cobalt transport protein CorA, partial [Bacteroidetes bacterium]